MGVSFGDGLPKVSCSLHFSQLWLSVMVSSGKKKANFIDKGRELTLLWVEGQVFRM